MEMGMVRWGVPVGFVEPVPVEDKLCSRLGMIEDVCGVAARFILIHDQTVYETGERIHVIKEKIVMPYDSIVPALDMTGKFVGTRILCRLGSVIKFPR